MSQNKRSHHIYPRSFVWSLFFSVMLLHTVTWILTWDPSVNIRRKLWRAARLWSDSGDKDAWVSPSTFVVAAQLVQWCVSQSYAVIVLYIQSMPDPNTPADEVTKRLSDSPMVTPQQRQLQWRVVGFAASVNTPLQPCQHFSLPYICGFDSRYLCP